MHPETTPDVPAFPPDPADSLVPERDAPAPRPWCFDGPQAEVVALGDRIAELSAPHSGRHLGAAEPHPTVRREKRLGRLHVVRRVAGLAHRARAGRGPRARAGGARPRRAAEAERRDAARPGLLLEDARGHPGGDAGDRGRPAERGAVGHRRPCGEDRAGVAAGGPPGGAGGRPAAARSAVATDVGGRERDGGGAGPSLARGGRGRAAGARGRLRPDPRCRRGGGGRGRSRCSRRRGGGAVAGATAGGCAGGDCRVRVVGRARPGDGGRPLSGSGAHGRGGADRSARHSRSLRRSRGNVGDGRARTRAARRRPGSTRGSSSTRAEAAHGSGGHAGPRRAVAPDPLPSTASGCVHPGRHGQTVLDEAGGIHISAETARRLACDASTVGMRHGPGGEILAVGRRTRTISPALRRALHARDRQCRFPGCRNLRVDAHHIEHWAHGGATALDNLVLLCRRHHRAVHEGGFLVTLDAAADVAFVRPDGRRVPEAPAPPDWTAPPLAPVRTRLERDGISIHPDTLTPDWRGERLDLDWVIHQLWRPRERRLAAVGGRRSCSSTTISRRGSGR